MNILTIDPSGKAPCQLCGEVSELRPYGPNGEFICFPCGMKDEETIKKKFAELISDKDIVIIGQ